MKKLMTASVAALALFAGAASADLKFPIGEGSFNWDNFNEWKANAPDLTGQTVTIAGPWLGPEGENFENMLAYFAEATGAEIKYTGSDSLEQQIVIDAEAGSAANLAAIPQPGLAAILAGKGQLTALPESISAHVQNDYAAGSSWVALGTYDNDKGAAEHYGLFFNINVKSLVWYVPENFEDAGYEIPQSMEELKALTEQMVADGVTPWCIGLGSGAATGWPATDWVEDMMLRTQTPEAYDQWVTNEMSFDDPRVIEAMNEFAWFAKNDAHVSGGAGAVASTDFRDAPKGLFSNPPACYMHRQASFVTAFFPEGTVVGEDADFFYFPSFSDKDLGKPVLGAGILFAITNPSDATNVFLDFVSQPIAHEIMMAQGSFLTPHKGVNLEAYADDTLRGQGEILLNATTFRFDGSDLMPGAIGAGAFWTGMVDFVGGKSAEDVAAGVQKAWDGIK